MNGKNIKIIIATHKQHFMPTDEMYLPLHVGKLGKQDLGYQGDDSGENISTKNPNFCARIRLIYGINGAMVWTRI